MNFQYTSHQCPLKVLVINPLTSASRLLIYKLLAGAVFGEDQHIDLGLLAYENEMNFTEAFRIELELCAFPCAFKVTVTSNLPRISDADVFCFVTNFKNPNSLDFSKPETEDQFDTLYLLIKIANNFSLHPPPIVKQSQENNISKMRKRDVECAIKRAPIFIADGLVALDILISFSEIIPPDALFCPTCIPSLAKAILGEYIKVKCNDINDVFVWAANDRSLHLEVSNPLLVNDPVETGGAQCDWEAMGKRMREKFKLDHTQFNASWFKKEFIEKVVTVSSKNPYGPIYKSTEMARALKTIWRTRYLNEKLPTNYTSLGVISDGSLGTIKGLPYVLPLVFVDDSWSIDKRYTESTYLQHALKSINKNVQEHHKKLMTYCRKFLIQNVINQDFIPTGDSTFVNSSYATSSTSII